MAISGFTPSDRQTLDQIDSIVSGAHLNGPSIDESLAALTLKVDAILAAVQKLVGGLVVTGTLEVNPKP